jgi:hypothetical protein
MDYRRPLISSLKISVNNEHRPVHTVLKIPKATKKLKMGNGRISTREFLIEIKPTSLLCMKLSINRNRTNTFTPVLLCALS